MRIAPGTGTMVFGRMAAPSMEAAEPRTLTLEELNYARQAALHVLRTRTAEEAIRIFTDGLKPVRGVRGVSSSSTMADSSSSDDDVDLDPSEVYAAPRRGRHGRRRSFKRDVATAPF